MLFLHSYLMIRTAVGLVAIILPVLLAFGDWLFVHGAINAKGL